MNSTGISRADEAGDEAHGFDETFDFVVVGSGGGSMCAGLVMRAAGKSVVILEKTDLVGGTTARSGGVMWIPNNRFLKRDGIEDSYEKAATYLDGLVGDHDDTPGATRERRHTYLAEAPQMIDFLVRQGIELTRVSYWPDYYDDAPGGLQAGRTVTAKLFDVNKLGPWKTRLRPGFLQIPADNEEAFKLPYYRRSWKSKLVVLRVGIRGALAKLTGKAWAARGMALQGRMLQASLRVGVDIRTEAPVAELLVENGEVKGVATTKDGRPWRIGARLGVLVNAGGFAHNQEMRDKYQPGTSTKWSMAAPGDTGEMILDMMRHGAAVAQMEEMVGMQQTIPPGFEDGPVKPGMQQMTASPHCILVDQSGVRYQNEGGSYMAYCRGMLVRNQTVPAVPSWAVFDSQFMERYMVAGTMPGSRKPQTWHESGYLRSGATVEELARRLNMQPARLRATVERFNDFVGQGRDADFNRGGRAYDRWLGDPFNKPSETLGRLEKGPYYAIPVIPGDVSTYGGVVTDAQARVLREDGTVIPGLYATGVSTASVMGRVYPGAGSSVGPSFVWGFVAAKHAAHASNTL
jgi:3-oxosteroid 1-dehydrogenase